MLQPQEGARALVRRLHSIFDLTSAEEQSILAIPMKHRPLRKGQDIIREGDKPRECCLVRHGMISRYKTVSGGKRQIVTIAVPGDMPDLQGLYLDEMDHSIGTLVDSAAAFVPHAQMSDLMNRHPRLAQAFLREMVIDASVSREWMLCLGQRDAYSHFAHLICELVVRLGIVGLSDGHRFQFGLTQEMVGDTLGISVVHVNRTLQELREEELVEWSQGVVEVKDWDRLVMAAQFDPTYLHLRPDRPGTEPLDGVLVGAVTK